MVGSDRERLADLAADLRASLPARDSFNFLPVVVPPAQCVEVGRELAALLSGRPFDFDAEAIAVMEQAGWDDHLAFERASMGAPLRAALAEMTVRVRDLAEPGRAVVVFNVNLPASHGFAEVANELYMASENGMIVLCVGGSIKAGLVMLHHKLALTGTWLVEAVDLTA